VVGALCAAAARGVAVRITMTDRGSYGRAFDQLQDAGAQLALYPASAALYIHAKVVLADYGTAGARVFIGSENFSRASLTRNRELGLILSDPAVLGAINATLAADFAGAQARSVPLAALVGHLQQEPAVGTELEQRQDRGGPLGVRMDVVPGAGGAPVGAGRRPGRLPQDPDGLLPGGDAALEPLQGRMIDPVATLDGLRRRRSGAPEPGSQEAEAGASGQNVPIKHHLFHRGAA
jgi:hypothetical protein